MGARSTCKDWLLFDCRATKSKQKGRLGMEPKVTFVIPSMCRSSIECSLDSLNNQTDQRWRAIVCFDHCGPKIDSNEKVLAMRFDGDSPVGPDCRYCVKGWKSSAGVVRNHAISQAVTDWVAFLDDDDIVTDDYVQRLVEESDANPDCDAVVFRMLIGHGRPRFIPSPRASQNNFKHGSVGISFAVKRDLFQKISFTRGRGEDYRLLRDIKNQGSKIHFSHYMTYLVKYREIDQQILDFKRLIESKRMRAR